LSGIVNFAFVRFVFLGPFERVRDWPGGQIKTIRKTNCIVSWYRWSRADDGFEVGYSRFLTASWSGGTYSSIATDIH